VLRLVGLGPDYKGRTPRQMSGGQQQRIAIARALMPDPDVVVLDEPTSSLDQSVRGRIIALLRSIQQERDVAYLFISHDLSTVRRIADRVAVMYLGRIVEEAPTEEILIFLMWAHTRGLQLAFIGRSDRDLVKEGLDAFHSAIFQDMVDNGTPEAQLPLFEQRVSARYAEYYSAAERSDAELGISVARHLAGSEGDQGSLAAALTERAIEVANPLKAFLEDVELVN
jgi:ABC-type dipeptide/oligopeptide/nickel transport system ATPase component